MIVKKVIPKPSYFGINMKFLRRLQGTSQLELANRIGISRNNVASYESAKAEPSAKVFLKVCSYFEVSPKDLLGQLLSEELRVNIDEVENTDRQNLESFQTLMEQFIIQTNDATQILDGYKEFQDFEVKPDQEQPSEALNHDLHNVVSLYENLIQTNWKLINSNLVNDGIN